jgi:hypothetical protein
MTPILQQTPASNKDSKSPLRGQLKARSSEPGFFTGMVMKNIGEMLKCQIINGWDFLQLIEISAISVTNFCP